MKTVELKYMPGDKCFVRGEYRTCYIEKVEITDEGVNYYWYQLDEGVDCDEIWDDGGFYEEEIGKTVFDTMEELQHAFPEDFGGYAYE